MRKIPFLSIKSAVAAAGLALAVGCAATPPPMPPSVTVLACPAVAPLKPPPSLPRSHSSPCPLGSKLAKCFDAANAKAAADDFDLLQSDRDYCRDAYDRVVSQ